MRRGSERCGGARGKRARFCPQPAPAARSTHRRMRLMKRAARPSSRCTAPPTLEARMRTHANAEVQRGQIRREGGGDGAEMRRRKDIRASTAMRIDCSKPEDTQTLCVSAPQTFSRAEARYARPSRLRDMLMEKRMARAAQCLMLATKRRFFAMAHVCRLLRRVVQPRSDSRAPDVAVRC